MVVKISEN
jgi:ribonuclease HI